MMMINPFHAIGLFLSLPLSLSPSLPLYLSLAPSLSFSLSFCKTPGFCFQGV